MKKGFTLAEVLITLGIVGVVSALTIPTLSVNIQKSQAGPGLMKAINSLEQATKMVMHDKNARTLTAACGDANRIACLTDVLGGVPTDVPGKYKYYNMTDIGSNRPKKQGVATSTDFSAISTKDGIGYVLQSTTTRRVLPGREISSSTTISDVILVDVNGVNKGPNALGKDTFSVELLGDGRVVPYGGQLYASIHGEEVWWKTECNNDATPTNGQACAGAIVDNGGQVKYNW